MDVLNSIHATLIKTPFMVLPSNFHPAFYSYDSILHGYRICIASDDLKQFQSIAIYMTNITIDH